MSAVSIDKTDVLEIEYQRVIKTSDEKMIETKDLYTTGFNIINSCVTEEQYENCRNYLKILEKIDNKVAVALFYYFRVRLEKFNQSEE